MEDFGAIETVLTVILAASSVIYGLWVYVVVPMYRRYRARAASWRALLDMTQSQPKMLAEIRTQLFPNGGASFFDKVNRIAADLKEQAIQLKFTNHHIDLLIATSRTASARADSKGHFTDVSHSLQRQTQRPEYELLGLGWLSVVCSEDRASVAQQWRDAIIDRREVELVFSWRLRDESLLKVQLMAWPLFGPHKEQPRELLGFVVSMRLPYRHGGDD